MELSERIERIKPFFTSFNVMAEESAAYAVVRFPNGWTIPDQSALKENFKVEIAQMQNGTCFVTEISNGTDTLFDAIDYVIDFNKKVQERKDLLLGKIKELQNLFATETLDRLKSLQFTFPPQKKSGKRSSAPAKKTETKVESVPSEQVEERTEEVKSDTQEAVKDNSLMALAKNMVE